MNRNDYYMLADMLNKFKDEFSKPTTPVIGKDSYISYVKDSTIINAIDMIKELAEYFGDESK